MWGELAARCPVSQFWDENESRLFVCETVPVNSDLHSSSQSQIEKVKHNLMNMKCICFVIFILFNICSYILFHKSYLSNYKLGMV